MYSITPAARRLLAIRLGDIAEQRESPESAVGNLQDVISSAIDLMSPDQVSNLIRGDAVQQMLELGELYGMPWVVAPAEGAEDVESPALGATLNRAVYYWGYYQQTRACDYLTGAYTFMRQYREHGGAKQPDLWHSIEQEVERVSAALPVPPASAMV